MSEAVVVCVLGMHRSGTSLATRLLNLLGVELGPEERLIEPGKDNPAGFWEHRSIKEIDDAILRAFGGSWDAPPELPPGWELDPRLARIETRARLVLEEDFGGAEPWGWKDPRTCLTLAFWQRLVPHARYLLCVRRAHEVVRSLGRRNGLTPERGLHLWCLYTKRALEGTEGRRRAIVLYDDLVEGKETELVRLAELAGRADRLRDSSVRERLGEFIDPRLRHHRTEARPQDLSDAYAHALGLADRACEALLSRSGASADEASRALAEALAGLEPVVRTQRREARERWSEEVRRASSELARIVPERAKLILVDQDEWGGAAAAPREAVPFLERDGKYWGPPADDETAVRELERLRAGGAEFIAFGSPAFWWLEHYAGFHDYLRARSELVLENGRLVVFRLTA